MESKNIAIVKREELVGWAVSQQVIGQSEVCGETESQKKKKRGSHLIEEIIKEIWQFLSPCTYDIIIILGGIFSCSASQSARITCMEKSLLFNYSTC